MSAQNEKYQSLTANLSGVRIHYLKAGSGKKTLVLIHGFGDTSRMWIPLFDEFGKDYDHCSGHTRCRRLFTSGDRLRQEDDRPRHSRTCVTNSNAIREIICGPSS